MEVEQKWKKGINKKRNNKKKKINMKETKKEEEKDSFINYRQKVAKDYKPEDLPQCSDLIEVYPVSPEYCSNM